MQNDLREALDRLKMAAHVYEDDEMAADCATLEALLSARPLALGGQQGESGDTAFKIASDLHAAYEQLIYGLPKYLEAENLTDEENMIREAYITLDVTAHRLAALSTTPARAETQDEGAAGEVVTALLEAAGFYEAAGLPITAERLRGLAERHSAHPSPTPAADADRVLDEAAKYLKAQYGVSYGLNHPRDRARIKNALKSTAAKEGGEA